MMCLICKSQRDTCLCHRCKDIMDYWVNEMYRDMGIVARANNGTDLPESDFIKALAEYVDIRIKEYNSSAERRRCQ